MRRIISIKNTKQACLTLSKVVVSMIAIIVSWWIFVCLGTLDKFNDFIDIRRLLEVVFILILFLLYNKSLSISLKEMLTKINFKILVVTLVFTAIYVFLSDVIFYGRFCEFKIYDLLGNIKRLFYLGLFEEMAFRGWGYTAFYSVYNDNSKIKLFRKFEVEKAELKALIMTNVFFALIHMQTYMINYHYTTIWEFVCALLGVFIAGAYFTIIFAKTKSIWNVIILHVFWDWFIGIMVF